MNGRSAQIAGLSEFARVQKEESRRRLIEAAERVFNRAGYIAPSVDDIAQEAGISRQTFYRHFDGKLAICMGYFERQNSVSLPLWTRLGALAFTDRAAIAGWITALFDYFEENRNSLRTFVEMGIVEPQFTERVKELVPAIIEQLGDTIPAFAAARGKSPIARKQWIRAWLLLYHLREQCNMNAMGFMSMDKRLVVDVFTDAFLDFIAPGAPPPSGHRRKLAP